MKKMKAIMMIAAALLFVATGVNAQTQEEMQASASRIEQLKAAAPKDCGVAEIDNAAHKSKSVADAVVVIDTVLRGEVDLAKLPELLEKIQSLTGELGEIGQMMGGATSALKEVKNPMKLKPANNSLGYVTNVTTAAGQELAYQGQVIAAKLKK